MSRVKVVARFSFDHNGNVARGQVLEMVERDALRLAKKGMVDIIRANEDLKKKDYTSALPAVPVLQKRTSKKSRSGVTQKQASKEE